MPTVDACHAFVTRVRASVTEAVLTSAELWRLSVFERRSDADDARAADERVARLEVILSNAEQTLEQVEKEAERRAAREAARIERLAPRALDVIGRVKGCDEARLARELHVSRDVAERVVLDLLFHGKAKRNGPVLVLAA